MTEQVTYSLELDALPRPSTAGLQFPCLGTQMVEPGQQKGKPMKLSD